MLDTLITSKTRIKLLLKFFLNGQNKAYLRNLEAEFGESSNGIRVELNKFEEAGLLTTSAEGNKKIYTANSRHPMYGDIRSILMKYTGLDKIAEQVISKLGEVEAVYLVGELARGLDNPIIDLVFVGELDKNYLLRLTERAEKLIHKKVRFVIFSTEEFELQKHIILQEAHVEILN
jgi:predicted nucleotidyltransferase